MLLVVILQGEKGIQGVGFPGFVSQQSFFSILKCTIQQCISVYLAWS